jgi:hypothetical protein
MRFLRHRRVSRQVSLLASGALPEGERAAVERHLSSCARCRRELAEMRELVELLAQDPVRQARPPISLGALESRVGARLEEETAPRPTRRFGLALLSVPATVAAALLVALLPGRTSTVRVPPPEPISVSDEILDRLDRSLARQQAVRYLSEAQDVLVTVASAPPPSLCDDEEDEQTLDVAEEARRSRELLARRTLLVETDGVEVASVRPVLEDVDDVLRELATLPGCVRARDLEAIHEQIAERRLLMKISLMTRELSG